MAFFVFVRQAEWAKACFWVMLKDFEIKSFFSGNLFLYYFIKQIDSMLLYICSVIDHRSRQNVVRTSMTLGYHLVPLFCSYHRRMAIWDLFQLLITPPDRVCCLRKLHKNYSNQYKVLRQHDLPTNAAIYATWVLFDFDHSSFISFYFLENITVLGSEDATTCHIVVLHHTGKSHSLLLQSRDQSFVEVNSSIIFEWVY